MRVTVIPSDLFRGIQSNVLRQATTFNHGCTDVRKTTECCTPWLTSNRITCDHIDGLIGGRCDDELHLASGFDHLLLVIWLTKHELIRNSAA